VLIWKKELIKKERGRRMSGVEWVAGVGFIHRKGKKSSAANTASPSGVLKPHLRKGLYEGLRGHERISPGGDGGRGD